MAEYGVTGVRYHMGEGLDDKQQTKKAEEFIKGLEVGTPVTLAAEPDNLQDREAIAVYMDIKDEPRRIGYIASESCKKVKRLLDSNGQREAIVSGKDAHVTFFVEIPNAPEVDEVPTDEERKLPECPLPQGIGLTFSDKEHVLGVVVQKLLNIDVSTDTEKFLDKAKRYMPLSRLSFCREDVDWREEVLTKLRKARKLKLSPPVKEELEQLYIELKETVGDFHVSKVDFKRQLFDQQLEELRMQAEDEKGMFAMYEKNRENHPDIIKDLLRWFQNMPHVELQNYKDRDALVHRLNYTHVSRQELYEVYAAILLLEKYGAEPKENSDTFLPKDLDTPRARKYFAKAMEKEYLARTADGKFQWIGTDNKERQAELAYFLGKVYNYVYTTNGNDGEPFPGESLDELFNKKRLYSSLAQVYDAKKVQRWRPLIDALFEED